jgi:hypothetical protein
VKYCLVPEACGSVRYYAYFTFTRVHTNLLSLEGANFFSNPATSKVRIPILSATESWSSVKPRVAAALGLPLERCRFFHKGKILEDRMGTLFQCNIKSDEVILVQELQILPIAERIESADSVGTSAANRQTTITTPSLATRNETNEVNDADLLGTGPVCDACFANPREKCRECGCNVCGSKDDDPENIGGSPSDQNASLPTPGDLTNNTQCVMSVNIIFIGYSRIVRLCLVWSWLIL